MGGSDSFESHEFPNNTIKDKERYQEIIHTCRVLHKAQFIAFASVNNAVVNLRLTIYS